MAKKPDFRPRNASEADVVLGGKIKDLRVAAGMSQEVLGQELGVSFQQIQKYEKGANRVSAVRLKEIADVFGITPADFFVSSKATRMLGSKRDLDHVRARLLKAFGRIQNAETRCKLADHAEALAKARS